jgi:hypothetical protein
MQTHNTSTVSGYEKAYLSALERQNFREAQRLRAIMAREWLRKVNPAAVTETSCRVF